jgi:glycosyltransferase involved in cell wall biosynthesis
MQGALPAGFLARKGVDLLYAPFGMVRFPEAGIPVVSMVVDLLHRDYPHSVPENERQWRESYFSTMVVCAQRFQVISDYTGQRLAKHYDIPGEKIFRTYLPIQDRLPNAPNKVRPANRYFFYPANFWAHKNHEALLIAYQLYHHHAGANAWDLVLTGSDGPRREAMQDLAKGLGIDGHVVFKGHVSETELAQIFSAASALVFPSLYEGFGIPAVEAMGFGVPVIASDAGSLREVVGEAGLLVDPRKPVELSAAMQKLASSEELQSELRRLGFERVKSFSIHAEVARLAAIFVETAYLSQRSIRNGHLLRRFHFLRSNRMGWSRGAADKVYRFLRERL